jgi:hypothetical protein
MNWKQVKEQAALVFERAAHFFLVVTVLIYLWACVVAGRPIGPKDYVRFNYHVIQWQPGQAAVQAASVRGR